MPPKARSLPGLPDDYTPRLVIGDLVTRPGEPSFRAHVLRCWADEEDDDLPDTDDDSPLNKPLLRGEVGIVEVRGTRRSIVPESTLELIHREFSVGDVVKRSLLDTKSGVILATKSQIQLEHAISHQKLDGWIPASKVIVAVQIEKKDKVVHGPWIGIVDDVYEHALVETPTRSRKAIKPDDTLDYGYPLVEHTCEASKCTHTDKRFFEACNTTVIDFWPLGISVSWIAINQELSPAEQDKHPEPDRHWYGPDMKYLTHIPPFRTVIPMDICVEFLDEKDDAKYGLIRTVHDNGTHSARVMRVMACRTTLTVKWQTGEETEESHLELVPYRNVDDYESWPGEWIVWKGDNGERRPAVVQTFDPDNRVANILFTDVTPNETQTVPVLELDTGGPGEDHYGVSLGQWVLFTPDNHSPLPEVPTIGRPPFPDDSMEVEKHRAMVTMMIQAFDIRFEPPLGDSTRILWCGVVSSLHLDGTVSVHLPNGQERRVGLKNLVVLNDMTGSDDWFEMFDPFEGMSEDDSDDKSDKSWETVSEDVISPQDIIEVDEVEEKVKEEKMEDTKEVEGRMKEEKMEEYVKDAKHVEAMYPAAGDGQVVEDTRPQAGPSTSKKENSLDDQGMDQVWKGFEMLEQAPEDHHYFNESRREATYKTYRSRLQKEHRTLMTSLPDNILVRTYEDRTDLMRVLIIGPEGTPYADAPFFFDVFLNPFTFPNQPPAVFFHSHTNGHGRCNPNLYEEGKVCLSILGTWSGDKSESWSPSKSSLLQVFVSISGLVLVRHPYHCEPAFAKLEGTREGALNSRLYSEKAYVLSRSFVRAALTSPPTGFEKELKYYYFERGRLKSVIDHATALMEKSTDGEKERKEEMWNDDVIGGLTQGAIMTLDRTMTSLKDLLKQSGTTT
ncbi:hypothetical protein M231_04221 [Tremella mesenterica]|uniref:UBC core domain-containing protein n=1 Tax=Tremella mesenterica TaxID=5217 RepID=A0A4Q1BL53_TREME|nr:hypothetical protein M231_04221 [Tremella mesenterica]